MHGDDVRRDGFESRDRIARAIKDHVRRIEVDLQVVAVHVLQETKQRSCGFLSGLESEGLIVRRGVIAYAPHDVAHGDVIRAGTVLRHEADVASDARDTNRRGEVAHIEGTAYTLLARVRWNESHGPAYGRDVGIALAAIGTKHGYEREILARQSHFPF